jgi:hypothetical protein
MSASFRKALKFLSTPTPNEDDWKSIRSQWRLVKCQQFKYSAYCICGVPCKNCFIIENSSSGHRATVGGKCINQFLKFPEFPSMGWICDVCTDKPSFVSFDAYTTHCSTAEEHLNRIFTPLPTGPLYLGSDCNDDDNDEYISVDTEDNEHDNGRKHDHK